MKALMPDSVVAVGLIGMCVIAWLQLPRREAAGGMPVRTAEPTDLLTEWFAGFAENEAPEIRHHRTFGESPERVFAALVQVVAAEAHILAIEDFGSVVVFEAQCGGEALPRTLVGRVSGMAGRSAITVTTATPSPRAHDERRRECLEVNRLLAEVTRRLHIPSRIGSAAAFYAFDAPPAGLEPAT